LFHYALSSFFFEKISFKILAYRGIKDKASAKGMLMHIFLSISTNLLNYYSKRGLTSLNEKWTLDLSSGSSLSIIATSP